MHTWGTYVHMYTKYEVSMFKPVPMRGVHKQCQQCANNANDINDAKDNARWTKHDSIRLFGP